MQCPTCKVDLVMSDRQGVEIDYCPKCRGVWLDRGEIDKIIEKAMAAEAPAAPPPQAAQPYPQPHPHPQQFPGGRAPYYEGGEGGEGGYYYGRRRKSLLKEIFDF